MFLSPQTQHGLDAGYSKYDKKVEQDMLAVVFGEEGRGREVVVKEE